MRHVIEFRRHLRHGINGVIEKGRLLLNGAIKNRPFEGGKHPLSDWI